MKHLAVAIICFFLLYGLSGCASSRTTTKEVKAEAETSIKQQEATQRETNKTEATLTQTERNERTNVVVNFTRIEYEDGTVSTDTTETPVQSTTFHYGDKNAREGKPPNEGRVIAKTTGTITINGNKQEAEKEQTATHTKVDEAKDVTTDISQQTEAEVKEKTKKTYNNHLTAISILLSIAAIYIAIRVYLRTK